MEKSNMVIVNGKAFRLEDTIGRLRYQLSLNGDSRLDEIDKLKEEVTASYLCQTLRAGGYPDIKKLRKLTDAAVWNFIEDNHKDLYQEALRGAK